MAILRRLCEVSWEIFVNKSLIYCGASPYIDLKVLPRSIRRKSYNFNSLSNVSHVETENKF